jgi:hypothetical protein
VTSSTNHRTAVGAICPFVAFNHKAPILVNETENPMPSVLFLANFNSFAFDAILRTKLNANSLVLFTLEQMPVIPNELYQRRLNLRTASDVIKDHVLRLTYTAHDMAAFARDMGYVNKDGTVKPPFIWNENERRHLRARLDALYFILYGLTDEDDIRYVLSTFPIVERKDREAFGGVYLTCELILWYKRALDAGDPDTVAPEAEPIRLVKRQEN